jgi:hypothetical protein
VLVLPDEIIDCEAALVLGDRSRSGHAQVLCSFYAGKTVRRVRAPLPPRPQTSAIVVLSPADTRTLARQLERSADEAEAQ